MIRHDHRVRPFVDRFPRVVADVHTLDDDRTVPEVADPPQVAPRHGRLLERRADVRVQHRAVREDDVGEFHQAAVAEEAGEPARAREKLPDVRKHVERIAREQLFDAVAQIALAHARDRRVDRDDENRIAGGARALEHRGGDVAPAEQIHLIPGRTWRRGADVLQPGARQRRKRVDGAGGAGDPRGDLLAVRMEHPRAADRPEEERERDRRAEDRRLQIDGRRLDGAARPEHDPVVRAAIVAHRDLVVRSAVDVVEHRPGQTPFRDAAQVLDIDGPGDPSWHATTLV